jgi:two-component system, cell cycle sensor histidine kinase and response regulator CckA
MHSLLKRQIDRHFGGQFQIPAEWLTLIRAIDDAYWAFDDDRVMLERSLDLSSQELLQANSEMRAIFQAIPDLWFRLDQQGTILDFKAGISNDLLLQPQAFFGKRIQDIPIRNIGDQFQRAIREVVAKRTVVRIEYSLPIQDQEFFYEARLVPLLASQIVAIIRNITEQKQAEEKLRHNVSLLRSTFESTADGLLVVDRAGRIVSFNERFVSLWRMPREILEARDDEAARNHALNQLKDPDAFLQRVERLYSHPEVEGFDILEFKDGRVFERYSCAQRLDGEPIGRVWCFRDITERRRSEESVLKLSRVVEQTADSVLITNAEGIIEYVNPAFEAMTGYRSKDILGKTPRILNSGRHDAAFFRSLWTTILSGKVFSGIFINRKKSGELYHAEKTITPIKDVNGTITHFVATEKDITERKHLEAQLRQSQKMEAFGQLAAGVAHDFNNILTVIQGHAALLQSKRLGQVEQASSTTEIFRASERAANLTRQLLTFSRRQPMQSRDIDLNETVAGITRMLQRLIGEHIALEARYAPGGAPVHADPGMMEQVLMNLAVNSRDAMPRGGKLIVQTETSMVNEAYVLSNPGARPGEYIRLSVSDTGDGIAPEDLPHIFEPFFTTKEVGKGTGLGLATVFGVVEQHNGWIEVESQLNQGTTFHVYVPRVAKGVTSPADSQVPGNLLHGTETILLVEDESPVRFFMQTLLENHGYRIHAAESGPRALEIWKRHRDSIDMLLTDMVMPEGMNGRELADRLRLERSDLKVLFCSGYSDEMLGKDSPLRKNRNFLEKPFEPAKLLQSVRDCVG